MAKDPSCEDQIDAELYGTDISWRLLFQQNVPDAVADPGYAITYVNHAIDELDYEIDEDERALFTLFSKAVAAGGATWVDTEIPADSLTYADMSIEDAISELLDVVSSETATRRVDKIAEDVPGVEAVVTVTLKIELSGGGPSSYVTAILDPETRGIEDIKYHYADWGDHAERPVDSESGLGQLAAYYSEVVRIAPLPTNEGE